MNVSKMFTKFINTAVSELLKKENPDFASREIFRKISRKKSRILWCGGQP